MSYSPPNKIMTLEDEKLILALYKQGLPAPKILKEIDKFKTSKTIYDVLKKHNVQGRTFNKHDPNLDHFYFSNIDTRNKAYLLGLIVSDGWIAKGQGWEVCAPDYKAPQIGFGLTEKDGYLVEWVRKEWKSQNKISTIHNSSPSMVNGKLSNCQPYKRILVTSRTMYQALHELGLTVNKSYVSVLPILQEGFYSDFFRGLIDGDGTIGVPLYGGNHKILSVRFLGSLSLIAQISLFLHKTLGLTYLLPNLHSNSRTLASIDYMISAETKILIDYLYKDKEDCMYMKRKWEVVENFKG